MKRSKTVHSPYMLKEWRHYIYVPFTAAIAGLSLSGCGDDSKDMVVYKSVADCANENPGYEQECEAAYESALKEAQRTAPKYRSIADCSVDFGPEMCQHTSSNDWVMPAMAGFMFAKLMNNNRSYYSQPLFSSTYVGSPFYHVWTTSNGHTYGNSSYRTSHIRVSHEQMKPKPTVNRTISRGGFGSTVSAKSSWGGASSHRSSRSGWGG